MSVESVLQRVAVLEQALANPSALLVAARAGGTAAPAATGEGGEGAGSSFAAALQSASGGPQATGASPFAAPTQGAGYAQLPTTGQAAVGPASGIPIAAGVSPLSPTLSTPGVAGGTGARIVQIAESQVGQSEQPPGSNESPAIAQYRTATAGAIPGAPWCAYFASWAARQAGLPLGAHGEGLGSVEQIWSWAQSTGRAVPNGPGVTPQPGDLIVFGNEHVGIVKDVLPNGQIQTIEGNYENKVAQNVRPSSEATGYVNMG
jgi:hypothetical protein